MLSTVLGRECWIPFGHQDIYPNQYIILMGTPGARKGTGLGIAKRLLKHAGYKTFSKDRTSTERFLVDMKPTICEGDEDLEALVLDAPCETYICAGEFLDFIGHGNMPFLTLLTNLWDNKEDNYEHPKLHGKSVVVYKPTINILGGATVKGFGLACPPEALGTGVMSRLLFIHSDPTDTKITWPDDVDEDAHVWLARRLTMMRERIKGRMKKTIEASIILDRMYKEFPGMDDPRFADYCARRFVHLLKLCMCLAASDLRTTISYTDAMQANTILAAAEKHMPKALGEFGKSKYSDVSNTIMNILGHAIKPVTTNELWKATSKDLTKQTELNDIMRNLLSADKIQTITLGKVHGYMPKHSEGRQWHKDLLLTDYLLDKEQ